MIASVTRLARSRPAGAGGLLEEAGDEGRCLHEVWAA
jgi:hypothetical protein